VASLLDPFSEEFGALLLIVLGRFPISPAVFGDRGKCFDDEFLADGTINGNARIIRGVVRPSYLRPPISKQMDDYETAAKLQNVAASKASLRLLKSPANASRGRARAFLGGLLKSR